MELKIHPSRQLPEFKLCEKAAYAVNEFVLTSEHEVYLAALNDKSSKLWTLEEIVAICKFRELNRKLSYANQVWHKAMELMNKSN